MKPFAQQHRDLVRRLEDVCGRLEASGDAGSRRLGAELLAAIADMDEMIQRLAEVAVAEERELVPVRAARPRDSRLTLRRDTQRTP